LALAWVAGREWVACTGTPRGKWWAAWGAGLGAEDVEWPYMDVWDWVEVKVWWGTAGVDDPG
jgi:hypothetical protein